MNVPNTADHYHRIAAGTRFESGAFIDGTFTTSNADVFENVNPATGEIIGTVRNCDAQDVDRAVVAARRAYKSGVWSRCAPERRKEVLLRLAALIRDNAEEIAVLESLDSGKTIKDCL